MTDSQPDASSPKIIPSSSTSVGNDNDSSAQLRRRLSRRTLNGRSSPLTSPNRRRSSILSFGSIDEAATSLHEDFLQPSAVRRRKARDDEITHWDSTPLAFAILPALAGTLFTNGSAFVTDVLLLAFAAVFLNWSIRVPREWYYSAQAVRQDIEPDSLEEDESAIDESDGTPKASPDEEPADPIDSTARQAAADQLKTQETLALLATFLFPALAAYLLHVIRAQLSLPSTSLVSDYNISIFLLAAEFWPARQVIRLVAARTLHLQRTASGLDDPFADSLAKGSGNAELLSRIAALEATVDNAPLSSSTGQLQPTDLSNLDARIQKRLEPRLDSLERAVRRYEKRYTTLAMVSEQRFQNLETRLQDALSLAAVAAQQGQRQPNILSNLLGTTFDLALLPAKVTWEIVIWPYKVLDEVYDRLKVILLGPQSSKYYTERRRTTRHVGDVRIKDDKVVREKQPRKLVR